MALDELERRHHHLHRLPRVAALGEEPLHVDGLVALFGCGQHREEHLSKGEIIEPGNGTVEQRVSSLSPLPSDFVVDIRASSQGCLGFMSLHCVEWSEEATTGDFRGPRRLP